MMTSYAVSRSCDVEVSHYVVKQWRLEHRRLLRSLRRHPVKTVQGFDFAMNLWRHCCEP